MMDMELAVRERAYYLWQSAGCPDGNSNVFWVSAQREILAAPFGAIARVTLADPDAPSATVVKKPRKARTSPATAKTKRRAA